jgi:hypothetical protein
MRVNECQTDPTFLMFWSNISDVNPIASSYRMRVNSTDDEERGRYMWMEKYETSDCSDQGVMDVGLDGEKG